MMEPTRRQNRLNIVARNASHMQREPIPFHWARRCLCCDETVERLNVVAVVLDALLGAWLTTDRAQSSSEPRLGSTDPPMAAVASASAADTVLPSLSFITPSGDWWRMNSSLSSRVRLFNFVQRVDGRRAEMFKIFHDKTIKSSQEIMSAPQPLPTRRTPPEADSIIASGPGTCCAFQVCFFSAPCSTRPIAAGVLFSRWLGRERVPHWGQFHSAQRRRKGNSIT